MPVPVHLHVLLAGAVLATPLTAQQPAAEPESEISDDEDFLSRWWNEKRTARWTITRDLAEKRNLVDTLGGFYFQLGLLTTGQYATDSLTSRQGLVDFEYDLSGAWAVFGGRASTEGMLSWWFRGGRPVGAPRDADLSKDIGSILGVNSNLESDPFFAQELYWSQYVVEAAVVTFGRIDPSFRYDFNIVANNQWEQFLSDALVNSSGVPFPDPGFGAELRLDLQNVGWLQSGIYQANSTTTSVEDLSSDEIFVAVEPTLAPRFELGQGHYRFLGYYLRSRGEAGFGFNASFDQEVGGGFVPFFRVSVADPAISEIRNFVSAGVGLRGLGTREDDMLGLGYVWSDPSDPTLRHEQLVELFYRAALSNHVAVTPDIQIVIDPARNPVHDVIGVFGLRLMVTF